MDLTNLGGGEAADVSLRKVSTTVGAARNIVLHRPALELVVQDKPERFTKATAEACDSLEDHVRRPTCIAIIHDEAGAPAIWSELRVKVTDLRMDGYAEVRRRVSTALLVAGGRVANPLGIMGKEAAEARTILHHQMTLRPSKGMDEGSHVGECRDLEETAQGGGTVSLVVSVA